MMKKALLAGVLTTACLVSGANADEKNNKTFVTTSIGYTMSDLTQTDKGDSVTLINSSNEDTAYNLSLGVGYRYNSNLFTTAEYSRVTFENAYADNLLLGVNYQFANMPLKPYIGASFGYSIFRWDQDPIANIEDKDLKSSQFTYGAQAGAEFSVSKNIDMFAQYQMLFHEHKTKVTSNVHDTNIFSKSQGNINIGIRYYF